MERNENNKVNEPDVREPYHVVVSFDSPIEGTIVVAARDEKHAKEIAKELFEDRKNLRIVDLYPLRDVPVWNEDTDVGALMDELKTKPN